MHPRNPYLQNPPDFVKLAADVPAFKPFLACDRRGQATIDFQNTDALRALTSALLERDFKLHVHLPTDRLCPAIPGRLDYILWVQDLVKEDRAVRQVLGHAQNTAVTGLDIGTGASAIYPLLFSQIDDSIRMICSDIDEASLAAAKGNIRQNQLESRIQIMAQVPEAPLFTKATNLMSSLDFTMCNPPFYASKDEIERLASEKEFSPHAVCTGAATEMVTEGGEVAFVTRMVRESVEVGNKVRWFSSLLGKASSVKEVISHLKALNCENYAVTEFVQGYTQRWAVAWSWADIRLCDAIARLLPSGPLSRSLPEPNELTYVCASRISREQARSQLFTILQDAGVTVDRGRQSGEYVVKASHQTWTRAARRGRKGNAVEGVTTDMPILSCRVAIMSVDSENEDFAGKLAQIQCDWLQGKDRQSFQSLFSFIVRKMSAHSPDGSA